jgi:hypothetical protein
MDWLWTIIATLGAVAAAIAGLCLIPGGAALVAAVLNSPLARALAAAGAVILMILTIRRQAYDEGQAAAKRMVDEANAEALRRRRAVERDVADDTDAEMRKRMERWSS